MAPKKSTAMPNPPSESEEDYSTEEEDEEESSSTEDENAEASVKKEDIKPSQPPSRPFSQIPKPPSNDQVSEEESESESDSDSEELPVLPPISKQNPIPSPAKTSKAKRVAGEETEGSISKRLKGKNPDFDPGEKSEDVKKQLFQRLWSEGDEVALLEGACAYREKIGLDVVKDMARFYEFIKNDMHFDVSFNQLKDKFCRLKKRFENGIKTGDKKNFTNEHNRKIFELSKKLWKGNEDSPIINGKTKDSKGDSKHPRIALDDGKRKVEEIEMGTDRFSSTEKWILKTGTELLDNKKRMKISNQLKSLQVDELELFLKRNEIVRDCAKMLLTAYSRNKKSDDDEADN